METDCNREYRVFFRHSLRLFVIVLLPLNSRKAGYLETPIKEHVLFLSSVALYIAHCCCIASTEMESCGRVYTAIIVFPFRFISIFLVSGKREGEEKHRDTSPSTLHYYFIFS